MKQIEVKGATVKDAIKKGLKLLGTSRDKVEVKVLTEENRGLFGMKGAREAKIRMKLKDAA
jgi:spoIIIJ-associated protein